jgi:signal transduction histidine kinase/ActR/RegA family two-component response regulator
MFAKFETTPAAQRAPAAAFVAPFVVPFVVFVACYVGAAADTWLTFPGIGAGVVFAPYAILTTALVRAKPRRWWIFLLAATAGDFLAHRQSGASLSFVLLAEAANHLRACLAALGVRAAARTGARGASIADTVALLLFGVFVAPAVGAVAGASIVVLHDRSADWWLAWQEWWLSNAITGLVLLPLLGAAVERVTSRAPVRPPPTQRSAEAALLSLGLLGVGVFVFVGPMSPAHPARLFWPLPFLLWAAVRFGKTGVSAALLAVTSLSIWGAVERRGPFVAQTPAENLLELQTFLLGISVPLLLLSAVFKQQQETAAALEESRRLHHATEAARRRMEVRRALDEVQREANQRKDEFLATLGHELRNPLAPIAIALETLRAAPPGSQNAARALESIHRQLQHMTRLLDDLLDISRITLGKIQLRRDTVNLADAVTNAIETTQPFIDTFEHTLAVELPREPVSLRGDGVRLTQIVANLLNNAAKYTEPGGRIVVTLRRERGAAVLSVRDNGIGIPSESLEKIFELFTQMPAARARAPGGLGVGLTLVRRLVELHGGTVEARSSSHPPRGTEIIVRLPMTDAPAASPSPPAPIAADADVAALRILAVDDNRDIAEGLAQVLSMWGHTVRTAPDGAAALEIAGAFGPEVVLVDLGLPKIDGLEVARQLVGSGGATTALLISMSGFGQEQARRQSRKAGFHHHLVKPIDMESLRAMLASRARRPDAAPHEPG